MLIRAMQCDLEPTWELWKLIGSTQHWGLRVINLDLWSSLWIELDQILWSHGEDMIM